MQCYNCNNIYNDYLGYCPYCGVKKEEFNVCSDCEEKLTKDILVCPSCGGKPIEETNEMKSERLNKEGLKNNKINSIDCFNEAIKFNKNNIDAWVNKSESLYHYTLYEANKCCDAGLKINKGNKRLLLSKAKALKKDEKNSNSNKNTYVPILNDLLKRCDDEIQKNELNEDVWIFKGEVLNELDNKKEAIECYSKALEINPKNEKSWLRKGFLCWIDSDYITEIESYKKAIELNPTNAKYYKKIGDRYEGYLHDPENALKYYKKSLELNPNDNYLWDKKGRLEEEIGEYEEALKSFSVSAKLNPEYGRAFLSKANILCLLNRFEEAITCYDDALEIFPMASTKNSKAKALVILEKYDEALTTYDESITIDPDYDLTYLLKGNLLHKLGRFEEEVNCYDLLLNKDNHDYNYYEKAEMLKIRALSKLDDGRYEEYFNKCLDDCNRLLEAFPEDSEYWERKADIFYFSGNLEEAFKYYDKTLSCDNVSNKEAILSSKGAILYELKDYKKAIEYFDEALKTSNHFYALEYKGYCLEELKQYNDAMNCYNKCLEINPLNKDILSKKSEIEAKMKK